MAGGGIGEAALIGAAVGGGSALLTGKDPLQGALLGGALGGVGGAFGGAAGAGGGAGAGSGAGAAANTVGTAGANVAGSVGANAAGSGLGTLGSGLGTGAPSLVQSVAPGVTPSLTGAGANVVGQTAGAGANVVGQTAGAAAQPNFLKGLMDKYAALGTGEKIGVGIAGSAALSKMFEPGKIDEPPVSPQMRRAMDNLGFYKFDPRIYRPAYANGGITDLDVGNTSRMPGNPVIMMRSGGISDLGSYSDGGRLLKGPGDGVSDSIPAQIGRRQPARLADGEFVVPARIVSELGNGSTDAGARQLYAMMDRVQSRRGKTTGKNRVAVDSKARKLLPA